MEDAPGHGANLRWHPGHGVVSAADARLRGITRRLADELRSAACRCAVRVRRGAVDGTGFAHIASTARFKGGFWHCAAMPVNVDVRDDRCRRAVHRGPAPA